ncbi:uncharacterized protein B0H18DRAFT_501877 [Fomitopsis serialis]|uniref:uncharacterized protein n=1 Tax=Fomitopsis serialis TaxID=139415 RepID=UPI0020073E73|nr:uncharacterized protein B0H18DRAFT_501877 [Neoantrodia serialis]KAH9922713.1 hypothetical protein B0H18DRAFT_501877 [Neoantrodia serialis]
MSTSISLLSGPEMIGSLSNWSLQGVLCAQVYIYHICFPKDPWSLKCFVYGVCIYELIQTILISIDGVHVFVFGYGDQVDNLLSFYNGWFSLPIMAGILSAAVQCFFAWRIFMLSRSVWLCMFITMIALGQMSIAIVSGVKMKSLTTDENEAIIIPYIDTWLAGSALADIVIAISMTVLLTKAKTGIRRSDAIIDRLIMLGVETGTLTAVIATLDLLFFTIRPRTYLHAAPVMMLSKLYANTLLINFNNRARTASLMDGDVVSLGAVHSSRNGASTMTGATDSLDIGQYRKDGRQTRLSAQASALTSESTKPVGDVVYLSATPEPSVDDDNKVMVIAE